MAMRGQRLAPGMAPRSGAESYAERNHQGLENVLLTPANDNHLVTAPVIRRKRLGGLLSYYHCPAA